MKRMLFNATQSEELRVAIVDGQKLIDLDIEHAGKEQRKSNIYKGVITRVEPSLEAAFVDYGTDRHGFLPFKEISRSYFQEKTDAGRARIQDVIKEGQEVIVQVDKDERGSKGAALTTFISLAGRYLVLMPNNPRGGGVSRRVEGEERNELRDTMAQLEVPNGMSIIARTAGIGRNAEELQWDLNYLTQLWKAIEEASNYQPGAFLIYQEGSLVIRAIRDYFSADIGEILIDTPDVHEQAVQFMSHVMPGNIARVKLYQDEIPLFTRFQIEHQIETAFAREVRLPSGGAIVIDHTEALVAIDVNSGRSIKGADIEQTAFNTNLEAAEEVARQMRLRDLGGLVVIDFIDMENQRNQRDVENLLRDALHHDRARVQMGKISRFGLLELSRQRLRPSLGETNHATCPRCNGTGHIRGIESTALHILRITQEEAMKDNSAIIQVQLPVEAATFLLNEKRADIHKVEQRTGVEVVLIPNIHLETPHYKITRIRHDDVSEENAQASYKMVDLPAESEYNPAQAEAAPVKAEAVVKGITPSTSAPIVPEKVATAPKKSILGMIKSLFGIAEENKEDKQPKHNREGRDGQRDRHPRNRNRNDRNRNRNDRGNDRSGDRGNDRGDKFEKQEANQARKDVRHEHGKPKHERNDRNQNDRPQQERAQQSQAKLDAEVPAINNATQQPQVNGNQAESRPERNERGGRRNRHGRRDKRNRDENGNVNQEFSNNANTASTNSPAPQTAPSPEKAVNEAPVQNTVIETQVASNNDSKTNKGRQNKAKKETLADPKAIASEAGIELVETSAKNVTATSAESAVSNESKPKKATAKTSDKKPAKTAKPAKPAKADVDAGIQLVETKSETVVADSTANKAPAKKNTKASANKPKWQAEKATAAQEAPLVMVETQKDSK